MSILSNLFQRNTQTVNHSPGITEMQAPLLEKSQENIPPVELFIDNYEPKPDQQSVAEPQNRISVFLNRNYHSLGMKDGYENHSQETLELGKKKIRVEFQLIIDQSIQEKYGIRLQMKNMIVDIGQIADTTRQTLENSIEELNSSLMLLQKQKELSSENEGWVMHAIHSYHQGFIQGLNDYILGESLLNSIKNI